MIMMEFSWIKSKYMAEILFVQTDPERELEHLSQKKESLKKLANLIDQYHQQNLGNTDLQNILDHKRSENFSDLFQKIGSTERNIPLLLLSQIAKDSQEIRQQIVKYNPELPVLSVRSLEEACIFIEDLLTSGATQEAKTTICILGP